MEIKNSKDNIINTIKEKKESISKRKKKSNLVSKLQMLVFVLSFIIIGIFVPASYAIASVIPFVIAILTLFIIESKLNSKNYKDRIFIKALESELEKKFSMEFEKKRRNQELKESNLLSQIDNETLKHSIKIKSVSLQKKLLKEYYNLLKAYEIEYLIDEENLNEGLENLDNESLSKIDGLITRERRI